VTCPQWQLQMTLPIYIQEHYTPVMDMPMPQIVKNLALHSQVLPGLIPSRAGKSFFQDGGYFRC
jgi:hypothetical protein